jgi:trehalose synthase
MTNPTLRRRSGWLALIAILLAVIALAVIAGYRRTSSQTPGRTAEEGSEYLRFLEERSMLFQAGQVDEAISGEGAQWREDYGQPESGELVRTASVWLLYYPGSVITKPDESVIGTWADPQFWDAVRDVGIDLLHTNPVKTAGGIRGREFTPTIDGWFDRISLEIDPTLGTEEEYRQMIRVAGERGAIVADDLVPLHTGLGADFRLAERGHKDYPGMYTMVEIDQKDWGLLPPVEDPGRSALVPRETAEQLWEKGYIPGLIDSTDAHQDSDTWSGWSATGEVVGADGRPRRSVYLHVFKPAQPALNWLDPTYASRRVLFGDTVRTIHDLGARVVRLDAVPFLGIEPTPNQEMAQLALHPLSVVGTNDLAFMVRKTGGWSFQELNVPIEQVKEFTKNGPDLSYDFFTRAQVVHPLVTGDVLPLRLAHHLLLELNLPAGTLIHDLQNHDEITYQLIDLGSRGDIDFEGQNVNGMQLKEQILKEMRSRIDRDAAPHNKLYRPEQDGIATTFAGFIAAALGVNDPYNATPDEVALIQRGHLLVAHANAMQPGVFAVSAWDLVGALPLPEETVADRTRDGDWRWVNRGGVDLLGDNPDAKRSRFGIPPAPRR